jgi:hypothetical protein
VDPAERWRKHWGALLSTLVIGLVVVNLGNWWVIAAFCAALFVAAGLGAYGR